MLLCQTLCYNRPVVALKELANMGVLYREWRAAEPKAAFLLVHGIGAHSERWDFLANYFLPHNISSYAIELRGFGETKEEPKGHIDNYYIYYEDIRQLALHIRQENPGKKLFIIGESLGALFTTYCCAIYSEFFDGLINISPAFKNNMTFPFMDYLMFIPNLIFNPRKMVNVPFNAKMITRDQAYGDKVQNDPREIRVASVRVLSNILATIFAVKRAASKLKMPVLFLIAGIDHLVDPRESRKVFDKLPMKDKKMIEYPEMLHALSIELGREKVFADILASVTPRL